MIDDDTGGRWPATSRSAAHDPDEIVAVDPWRTLRRHTPARIALGRAGVSLPTDEVLGFAWAHAQARDAVHRPLDVPAVERSLTQAGWPCMHVASQATDRRVYLMRPDLGRRLDHASVERLRSLAATLSMAPDVVFVLGDGLSPQALEAQAVPLLSQVRASIRANFADVPILIASQARVALGDEVGELLRAKLMVMMIGERPGLSSPHSMGVYVTHAPRIGTLDAARNCVSNIHALGIPTVEAAHRLRWLIDAALARGATGIALKDDSMVTGGMAVVDDRTGMEGEAGPAGQADKIDVTQQAPES